jgi:hypothetical protein
MGAASTRPSPRPLRRGWSQQSSGASRRENADAYLDVIACDKREAFAQGSIATKQSTLSSAAAWIASLALAMTA